jgi:hypothetical protein
MSRTGELLYGLCVALLIAATGVPVCPAGEPTTGSRPPSSAPRARAEQQGNDPKSVDLRPAFEKWSLDPRVQGKRGTCSAFVVTEAIEYAVASKQAHPKGTVPFSWNENRDSPPPGRATRMSVEFLNWASNKATNRGRNRCW